MDRERLQRNAVSFQGVKGSGCDVRKRAELDARDHVEGMKDDIENMAILWYVDRRL